MPTNEGAHFKQIGSTSPQAGFGHITTRIDVDKVSSDFNSLVTQIDRLQRQALEKGKTRPQHEGSYVQATFLLIYEEVRKTRNCLQSTCNLVNCVEEPILSEFGTDWQKKQRQVRHPWHYKLMEGYKNHRKHYENQTVDRDKRFIEGLLSMASAGMSIYSLSEIETLKHQMHDQQNSVGHIGAKLEQNSLQIDSNEMQIDGIKDSIRKLMNFTSYAQFKVDALMATQYVSLYLNTIQDHVQGIEKIVMENRVPIEFFRPGFLEVALKDINNKAKKVGLRSLHQNVPSLLREKISYTAKMGQIYCFLHTPLIKMNLGTLYQYVEVPFPLDDGRYVLPIVEEDKFTVDDKVEEFLPMSESALDQCLKREKLYICQQTMYIRAARTTCLGALFQGLPKHIMAYCKFKDIKPEGELIVPLGRNSMLTFIPKGHVIHASVSCETSSGEESPSSPLRLSQNENITLPEGCALKTPRFKVKTLKKYEFQESFVMQPLMNFSSKLTQELFQYEEIKEKEIKVPSRKFPPYSPQRPLEPGLGNLTGYALIALAVILIITILTVLGAAVPVVPLPGIARCQRLCKCLNRAAEDPQQQLHATPQLDGPDGRGGSVSRSRGRTRGRPRGRPRKSDSSRSGSNLSRGASRRSNPYSLSSPTHRSMELHYPGLEQSSTNAGIQSRRASDDPAMDSPSSTTGRTTSPLGYFSPLRYLARRLSSGSTSAPFPIPKELPLTRPPSQLGGPTDGGGGGGGGIPLPPTQPLRVADAILHLQARPEGRAGYLEQGGLHEGLPHPEDPESGHGGSARGVPE